MPSTRPRSEWKISGVWLPGKRSIIIWCARSVNGPRGNSAWNNAVALAGQAPLRRRRRFNGLPAFLRSVSHPGKRRNPWISVDKLKPRGGLARRAPIFSAAISRGKLAWTEALDRPWVWARAATRRVLRRGECEFQKETDHLSRRNGPPINVWNGSGVAVYRWSTAPAASIKAGAGDGLLNLAPEQEGRARGMDGLTKRHTAKKTHLYHGPLWRGVIEYLLKPILSDRVWIDVSAWGQRHGAGTEPARCVSWVPMPLFWASVSFRRVFSFFRL